MFLFDIFLLWWRHCPQIDQTSCKSVILVIILKKLHTTWLKIRYCNALRAVNKNNLAILEISICIFSSNYLFAVTWDPLSIGRLQGNFFLKSRSENIVRKIEKENRYGYGKQKIIQRDNLCNFPFLHCSLFFKYRLA